MILVFALLFIFFTYHFGFFMGEERERKNRITRIENGVTYYEYKR
jgi:hypothetical protein